MVVPTLREVVVVGRQGVTRLAGRDDVERAIQIGEIVYGPQGGAVVLGEGVTVVAKNVARDVDREAVTAGLDAVAEPLVEGRHALEYAMGRGHRRGSR